MRFLLGVLLGYSMRGRKRLLITVLAIGAVIVFLVLPTIFLTGLALSVQQERLSRSPQTAVPEIKGLTYQAAEAKLRAANLKMRIIASRRGLSLKPGTVVDQTPTPGEQVNYGYPVSITITKADTDGPGP